MSMYPTTGGWYYNPFYGMMTYLPGGNGMYRSPFGYFYYSPNRVQRYYQSYQQAVAPPVSAGGMGGGNAQARTWNSDNGYYTTQSRSAGAVSMPSGRSATRNAGCSRQATTCTSSMAWWLRGGPRSNWRTNRRPQVVGLCWRKSYSGRVPN